MVLSVGFGSSLGGTLRLLIQEAVNFGFDREPGFLMAATVFVNALAGAILGWVHRHPRSEVNAAFMGTGFCGGFSTFSLFAFDAFALAGGYSLWIAGIYVFFSFALALCLYHAARFGRFK